jgi:hypothetical protein
MIRPRLVRRRFPRGRQPVQRAGHGGRVRGSERGRRERPDAARGAVDPGKNIRPGVYHPRPCRQYPNAAGGRRGAGLAGKSQGQERRVNPRRPQGRPPGSACAAKCLDPTLLRQPIQTSSGASCCATASIYLPVCTCTVQSIAGQSCTAAQQHSGTAAQLHSGTAAQLHSCTAAQRHSCTVAHLHNSHKRSV